MPGCFLGKPPRDAFIVLTWDVTETGVSSIEAARLLQPPSLEDLSDLRKTRWILFSMPERRKMRERRL